MRHSGQRDGGGGEDFEPVLITIAELPNEKYPTR
jgi:hypothetical protein